MHSHGLHSSGPALEMVLKCDSAGSVEAVDASISALTVPGVDIRIIYSGVGPVSKSDILMAETAGRLIIGFQTSTMPHLDSDLREHNVEVRLYDVIYTLIADIKEIASSLLIEASHDQIIGSAKVIALFKSSRKGIIIGCEVTDGYLARGEQFRIFSTTGPVYSGTLESIHIGPNEVQRATKGQQAGIKLKDFNKAKVGDMVESFRPVWRKAPKRWTPRGMIVRK